MNLSIEFESEDNGRWIAEIPELPGALTYANTPEDALARSAVLALRAIAEQS
jgi:predicted RNase H-like HicB family nuclease